MTYLRDITDQADDHEDLVRNVRNEDCIAESRRELLRWCGNHFWSGDNKPRIHAIKEAQNAAERLGIEMVGGRLWMRIADEFDDEDGLSFTSVVVPQPNHNEYH